jgi:hypothetical protein
MAVRSLPGSPTLAPPCRSMGWRAVSHRFENGWSLDVPAPFGPDGALISTRGPHIVVRLAALERSMTRNSVLLLVLLLGSLVAPRSAYAQLTPPAGSAGAGNSPISGVPFGPANPRVLSDPSGIGNASNVPPLGRNPPTPVVSSTPTASSSSRVVTPYAGGSQRIISADRAHSRSPQFRRRSRPQVSKFTGICRGC